MDFIEYSVCLDCFMTIAHDDSPEIACGHDKIVHDATLRELNGRKGHFSVGVQPTEDDPEGYGEEEFSWRECELCRSTLGGSRHGVTLFFTDGE